VLERTMLREPPGALDAHPTMSPLYWGEMEKQRAIDTRNALEEILRGQPHLSKYTSFYVKPEQAENLTPEEIELMRMYSTLQGNAREYTKEQRQKIGIRQ